MSYRPGKLLLLSLLLPLQLSASEAIKEDNQHVRTWNKFALDVLALHNKLVEKPGLEKKTATGSYFGNKDFYIEHAYYQGERLVSKVQWEKENPQQLHTIETFIHDKQGRVIRDYMAAYLPGYHNAPTQTLISFHNYNGKLHAFRTFDASGYRIIERCEGTNSRGEQIEFILDEDEIAEAMYDKNGIMNTADYRECFKGLTITELGDYVVPR